jgi:hypothetical protein
MGDISGSGSATPPASASSYPLIDALYERMVEIFRANTPDDDHIHTHPEGALEEAAKDVIGDDDESEQKFLAIIREAFQLVRSGEEDSPASNHAWGICVESGHDDSCQSYWGLVALLFKSAMWEMVHARNPELVGEAARKTEEWERRRVLPRS